MMHFTLGHIFICLINIGDLKKNAYDWSNIVILSQLYLIYKKNPFD